jgi:hypothetical protein
MSHAEKPRLVELLVLHAVVKALYIAVLHRPFWSNIMPLHTHLPTPCENSVAIELGAIIDNNHARAVR